MVQVMGDFDTKNCFAKNRASRTALVAKLAILCSNGIEF
jgi:hypothetical protein